MAERKPVTHTMSDEALEMCETLKASLGVSRSAVLEMAVREFAERRKPPEPAVLPSPSTAASGG